MSNINTKILVTGASGFVGRALCAELAQHDYKVLGTIRKSTFAAGYQCELTMIQDIGDTVNWLPILSRVGTVVHLAARVHVMNDTAVNPLTEFRKVNVGGTLNLAQQAVKAGVKRFIFISSIKVNGEYTKINQPFTEADIANPQDAYAESKCEAEHGLLLLAQQTGLEVVIIRPPLVYGVGVKANFASMMRAVHSGIPMPLGAIYNKRSFVFVGNLVSLILRCIDHPAAVNEVFLVSDGCDLSTTELLQHCALALGVNARLLPIPQRWLEIGAALVGKQDMAQRLCGNLQVDISKAHSLLGWTPSVSVVDGLRATAQNCI